MWAAQKALYHDFLCKIVGIPEGPIDIHRYWPIRVLKPSAWPWAQASELNRLLPNLVYMRRLEVKFCSSKRWYLRCGPSSLSWTWRVIDLNFFQSFSIRPKLHKFHKGHILIIPPSLGPVSGQLNMLWDVCWGHAVGDLALDLPGLHAVSWWHTMGGNPCDWLWPAELGLVYLSFFASTSFDTPWFFMIFAYCIVLEG